MQSATRRTRSHGAISLGSFLSSRQAAPDRLGRDRDRGVLLSGLGSTLDQHFAVALDRQLITVPSIDFKTYPDGISADNRADITCALSSQTARDLATLLRFAPLPTKLTARCAKSRLGIPNLSSNHRRSAHSAARHNPREAPQVIAPITHDTSRQTRPATFHQSHHERTHPMPATNKIRKNLARAVVQRARQGPLKGTPGIRPRVGVLAFTAAIVLGAVVSASALALTPGWECVPTTAGQAVTSGGTLSTPRCGSGSTAVLAPTYVGNTVGNSPTVQFAGAPGTGVNVQIVNGKGSTASDNGAGNLVIGYNESPGTQTGSHNLLLGTGQSDTSYGGIDAGTNNALIGPDASILGGSGNTAGAGPGAGIGATVSGGSNNRATGTSSSVSGGQNNLAAVQFGSITGGCDNLTGIGTVPSTTCNSGGTETVAGGEYNRASDQFSSITGGCDNLTGTGSRPNSNCASSGIETVSGGRSNAASGPTSSVSGGIGNSAIGQWSSVSGGADNYSRNDFASVSGGDDNAASGAYSSVSGGYSNIASDPGASIVGGCDNLAGAGSVPPNLCQSNMEAILGGSQNTASGPQSSISGGVSNIASGTHTSVSGGGNNTAKDGPGGGNAWVGGGHQNIASNVDASVTGGQYNLANDQFASVTGGCGNLAGSGILLKSVCQTYGSETVSGGWENTASGLASAVSGGGGNNASGAQASISGGQVNMSKGLATSILGGLVNTVSSNCGTFPATNESC
jgi:hypothetical protein